MAFQGKKRTASQTKTTTEEPCLTCGAMASVNTVHCNGSSVAYGCLDRSPHHGKVLRPRCWECGSDMGCSNCVPRKDELICKRCRVKANCESLLNGGPISKYSFNVDIGRNQVIFGTLQKPTPDLGEYPQDWVRQYAAQQINMGRLDTDETAEFRKFRAMVHKTFGILAMEIPGTKTAPGKAELNRQRNQQVEAMVGKEGA